MESFGLLYVHIIAVLVRLDITSLSNSLVLPRWSKIARMDLCLCNPHIDPEATYRARVGALLQHRSIFQRLQCQATGTHSVPWEGGVKDPVGVRTKGTGRGNEPVEFRGIKRRRCSTCGVLRHRRTRCPNGPTSSRQCGQELDMHPSTETFETVIWETIWVMEVAPGCWVWVDMPEVDDVAANHEDPSQSLTL
ncbi:hypothetical protein AHAS_Ahas14G0108700 [Arachis hypogaea]